MKSKCRVQLSLNAWSNFHEVKAMHMSKYCLLKGP